jgi:hypothetical protein
VSEDYGVRHYGSTLKSIGPEDGEELAEFLKKLIDPWIADGMPQGYEWHDKYDEV